MIGRRVRSQWLAPLCLAVLATVPYWFTAPPVEAVLASVALAAAGALLTVRRRARAVAAQCEAAVLALTRVGRGERPEGLRGLAPLGPLGPLLELLDEALPPVAKRLGRLEREREELQTLLASMEEGVVAIDRHARVLLLNDAACRLLGVPFGSGSGQRLWEVSRIEGLREALLDTVADGKRRRFALALEGARAPRELEIEIAPLRTRAGAPRGAVAVVRDVSEARRLEALRREFVANVSHELKTPLSAMRALIETMLAEREGDARPTGERVHLERLYEQTERLEGLVADLLALARLDDVRGRVQRRVLDFAELVERSAAAIEPALVRAGLRLELEVPDDPVPVLGDRKALRRLVDNLLDNARAYSEPGGCVSVRLRLEPDGCVLEVADEGPGIAPEHHARIFERFYRVDPWRDRGRGGSGLGLAIVKQVAKRHGGAVALRSRPGHGSTFTVQLPRATTH